MLSRDHFVVANLLVELSSVKYTAQNHRHNCHQYNTYSSFFVGALPWTLTGQLTTFPDSVFGWRLGHLLHCPPHLMPLMTSVSHSGHHAFQPLH